jgi:hypothetical protein
LQRPQCFGGYIGQANHEFGEKIGATKVLNGGSRSLGTLMKFSRDQTFDELDAEETRLLTQVQTVSGTIEQKAQQLRAAGVFQDYAAVHKGYAELAERTGNLEALKRALFLQWYTVSEPPCFTGLSDMDPQAEAIIFRLLEQMLTVGRLDNELAWMLPYYGGVTGWYFEAHAGPRLQEYLRSAGRPGWQETLKDRKALSNRGQMSYYWLSLEPTLL